MTCVDQSVKMSTDTSLGTPALHLGAAAGVPSLRATGGSNPRPRMAMNAAQHKIVNSLKTFFLVHQFLLVFLYLKCVPKLLFLFQGGPEPPKGWTPWSRTSCHVATADTES